MWVTSFLRLKGCLIPVRVGVGRCFPACRRSGGFIKGPLLRISFQIYVQIRKFKKSFLKNCNKANNNNLLAENKVICAYFGV